MNDIVFGALFASLLFTIVILGTVVYVAGQ